MDPATSQIHPLPSSGGPAQRVALFDLDDVLLQGGGYHASLRAVVRTIGRALGFGEVDLPPQAITLFEAAGLTAEWDSSAVCAALLLQRVWRIDPGRRLPSAPPLPFHPPHSLEQPDFLGFARALLEHGDPALDPRSRAEAMLRAQAAAAVPGQADALSAVVRTSRTLERSLTHRLVQEFNLGSARFETVYGMAGCLGTESQLEAMDRAALGPVGLLRLHEWLARPGNAAAVFTNRPCLPPDGSFGVPEAELGVETAGVPSLPLVGLGTLAWLSSQRRDTLQDHLKPSPVHALAALRSALGEPIARASVAAARLALDGEADDRWAALNQAEVVVFEDSARGLTSAIEAARCLASAGVQVQLAPIGVTWLEAKAAALLPLARRVVPSLEDGLAHLPGWRVPVESA